MHDYEIVEITLAELPKCSAFWGYPNTRLEAFLRSGARKVFALQTGGEYAGGCALIFGETKIGHVSDFCVREDLRGRGLGSRVLAFAIGRFTETGMQKVRLHVYKDNPKAIRLYEKFGFQYAEDITPAKIAMIKELINV